MRAASRDKVESASKSNSADDYNLTHHHLYTTQVQFSPGDIKPDAASELEKAGNQTSRVCRSPGRNNFLAPKFNLVTSLNLGTCVLGWASE